MICSTQIGMPRHLNNLSLSGQHFYMYNIISSDCYTIGIVHSRTSICKLPSKPNLADPACMHLSGETRKAETDRVAVGTFSGEGLSPVFQERAPWSIMDLALYSGCAVAFWLFFVVIVVVILVVVVVVGVIVVVILVVCGWGSCCHCCHCCSLWLLLWLLLLFVCLFVCLLVGWLVGWLVGLLVVVVVCLSLWFVVCGCWLLD